MSSRKPAPVRATAARAVDAVMRGGSTLESALERLEVGPEDRALLRELTAGTLRFAPRLERIVDRLSDRPAHRMQAMVRALLLVGLYQLSATRIPPHAAVDRTVAAANACGAQRARGMINAVLRRYDREREDIAAALAEDPVYASAHPAWLIDRLRADWGDEADGVLAAGNRRPTMWLRAAGDREQRMADLSAADIEAEAPESPDQAIRLKAPTDVHRLPGFDAGLLSVQDASAQYAAGLLDAGEGMRVLDACAAPGGKALHLLQHAPGIALTALDVDGARLERVRENLDRAQLDAELVEADAREPDAWWDGTPYDRILVDAPCSGTGVIRRHPDIKVLRRDSDIAGFAEVQRALLAACWTMLAPGGRLLYATCSVLHEEGDAVIAAHLDANGDASSVELELPVGRATAHGWQILSGEADGDGFHYACLERAGSR